MHTSPFKSELKNNNLTATSPSPLQKKNNNTGKPTISQPIKERGYKKKLQLTG
jgi:hypothetical protein